MRRFVRPIVAGLIAAGSGLAAAELLAALTRPASSPLVTIGGAVIDATPTTVKEFAVREFGTADKPLLLGGILTALALAAAAIGLLAARHRRLGVAAAAGVGFIGVAAALSRPAAQPFDALPAVVAGLTAAAVLALLTRRPNPQQTTAEADGRRDFLRAAAIFGGAAAVAGGVSAVLRHLAQRQASRSRELITFPPPADPAGPPVTTPAFYTGNAQFYRVDTALTVPRIDADSWTLRIGGMVERPMTLTFGDLLRCPLSERDITLNCVSSEVGGPYIGTARWLGVPLATLLREAGVRSGADQVVARSVEGMTIGTPVETVLDGRDAMLVVAMNGEALPLEHGFPVRMLTPGLYGYAGACKWVTEIELSTFEMFDAYWVRRGWAARAPVKTASRIDRPKPFARLGTGVVTVAGVAWAQRRGIAAVEVQVDDGPWEPAELLPAPTPDTWVQWRYPWQASTAGGHSLRVRATDSTGRTQTEQRRPPFPDGATGWHTITVAVE